MQKATFISILKGVIAAHKLPVDDTSLTNIDIQPYQMWAVMIEKRCREAYERANWASLILTEQRTADATGLISFAQNGKTRIGKMLGVYVNNPETSSNPQPKPWIRTDGGAMVYQGASNTYYVQFRRAAPRFTTTYYVPNTNQYEPGTVVYWPSTTNDQLYGNCYEARVDTAGTGFYWDEQIIPIELFGWLVESVYADSLMKDRQRQAGLDHLNDIAYPELARAAKAHTAQQAATSAPIAGANA